MTESRMHEIAQLHAPHIIALRETDDNSEIIYVPCSAEDTAELEEMIYAHLLSCLGKAYDGGGPYQDHVFGSRDTLEYLYIVKHPERRSYETFYGPAMAAYKAMKAEIDFEPND